MAYFKPEGFAKANGEWERIPTVDLSKCEYDKNRRVLKLDRKSTRLNSSHIPLSRMPSSA